jgi:endonuclease/exonuclease/phosphatase family metal-dependent hydrolase
MPATRSIALVLLIQSLLLSSLALPGVASTPADGPGPEVDLRVMTYNIQHARGLDDDVDVMRIADVIRDAGADVVGLQEVDVAWDERSGFEDQARLLADELDMHVFFAPIYSLDPVREGAPRREYGLATLSRYPIIAAQNHEIMRFARWVHPGADPQPYPGFPEVTINVKGTHVNVFNTHLQSSSGGDETDVWVRGEQVADMLEIIGTTPTNTLLVGDLNEDRTWPEATLDPLFDVFEDVWELVGIGPGYTAYDGDPDRRIDYVLTSPDLEVTSAEVIETDASDHFPVVADITIQRDPGRSALGIPG